MKIFEGIIKNENYELILEKKELPNGILIDGKIKGRPGKVKLFEVEVEGKLFVNNWQSWGPAKVIDPNEKISIPEEFLKKAGFSPNPNPDLLKEGIVSDYFIAKENILVGFLSSKIGHPYFYIKEGKIEGFIDYFNSEFEDFVEIEPLLILFGKIDHLLLMYANKVKEKLNPVFSQWNPVGWSSWYYYFEKLTWEDILKNLELSRKYPFEVFQIDDSWQKDIGDWEPKEKFPHFSEMAQTIRKHGLKPGIWLAPFSVSETSSIFKKHKDWLVKDKNNEPLFAYENWNKKIYALDLTHPEVKQFLKELFKNIKNAGFEYFKIDFLFAGAIPGKRFNENITPIQAYREGLNIIRKAVGEDSFILGCGAPLLPSVGFVDGMRIGPDTAPYYDKNSPDIMIPNAYYALRNTITRYFMNERWWWNDPDCLLLRKKETYLTTNQKKMFSLTSGLLNNMLFLSDNLELELEDYLLDASLKLKGGIYFVKNIMGKGYEIVVKKTKIGDVRYRICLETEKSEFIVEKKKDD
ncbi:MAG: alpha-galactosidase [Thermosipho sp. (in: thermotogales)]|nr:alpha-galactosidase [Thermosipho sp. (in: thermotogales)]